VLGAGEGHDSLSGQDVIGLGLLMPVQGEEPVLPELGDPGDQVVGKGGVGREQRAPGEFTAFVVPPLHGAVDLLEHEVLGGSTVIVSHAPSTHRQEPRPHCRLHPDRITRDRCCCSSGHSTEEPSPQRGVR
jgi:hypothetical protein